MVGGARARADLPDSELVPAAHRRWYEDAHPVAPMVEIAGRAGRTPKRRGLLIGLLIALAIAVVLASAWAVDISDLDVFFVTLLIAIPVATGRNRHDHHGPTERLTAPSALSGVA